MRLTSVFSKNLDHPNFGKPSHIILNIKNCIIKNKIFTTLHEIKLQFNIEFTASQQQISPLPICWYFLPPIHHHPCESLILLTEIELWEQTTPPSPAHGIVASSQNELHLGSPFFFSPHSDHSDINHCRLLFLHRIWF